MNTLIFQAFPEILKTFWFANFFLLGDKFLKLDKIDLLDQFLEGLDQKFEGSGVEVMKGVDQGRI